MHQVLADVNDPVPFERDLGGIIQVEDAINLPINCENDFVVTQRLTKQCPGCGRFEDMVCHKQQEGLVNQVLRAQD